MDGSWYGKFPLPKKIRGQYLESSIPRAEAAMRWRQRRIEVEITKLRKERSTGHKKKIMLLWGFEPQSRA